MYHSSFRRFPALTISLLCFAIALFALPQGAQSQEQSQQPAAEQGQPSEEPVAPDQQTEDSGETESNASSALDFTMTDIDGGEVELSQFQGKVVVVVNVASRCGLTPHYAQLQELYTERADEGLVVLGFPCSQFRNQELATSAEIKEFCTDEYGVTFPMFEKIMVNGDERCGLYEYLCGQELAPAGQGNIQWNFEKFVIGRDGAPLARFSPPTRADSEEFMNVVNAALAAGGEEPATDSGQTVPDQADGAQATLSIQLPRQPGEEQRKQVSEILITLDGITGVEIDSEGRCQIDAVAGTDLEAMLNGLAEEHEIFQGWERR